MSRKPDFIIFSFWLSLWDFLEYLILLPQTEMFVLYISKGEKIWRYDHRWRFTIHGSPHAGSHGICGLFTDARYERRKLLILK